MNVSTLMSAAEAAGRQIPPLWPLSASVAVNPYLGQAHLRLAEAGARLAAVGGGPVTMPRIWYAERIDRGIIADDHLAEALAAAPYPAKPATVDALKRAATLPAPEITPLPTVADLAATTTGIDWPGLIETCIGTWAGSYFDAGQALWVAPREKPVWAAYRHYASHDLTPEIMGLAGFGQFMAETPDTPSDAIARAVARLTLPDAVPEMYFHRLLMTLGGWAQFARYRLWRAELIGETTAALTGMLAARLVWEEALFDRFGDAFAEEWEQVQSLYAQPAIPGPDEVINEILQDAAERSAQRALGDRLAAPVAARADGGPCLQAVFCIDVRSEVFRRALEAVDPAIDTRGFAGFFGMLSQHRRFASDVPEDRLPVLLNPRTKSTATSPSAVADDTASRYAARAKRAWGRFKLAAVASFAFVEAMGPIYGGKLFRDAVGRSPVAGRVDPMPTLVPEPDLETRIGMAETVLRAMSLTTTFAPIVLLAGHGATVTNNPHASALQCGACGGYAGDVNARLLAGLLNDLEVRAGLAGRGITIPDRTVFVGALHDTTTDTVTLFEQDIEGTALSTDLAEVRAWLARAGAAARAERALRLPRAGDAASVMDRARNWAEVRPEWGLAGCKAFIAAPRGRTCGRDLQGRAFLHDYIWTDDAEKGFPVLELILTAPVVVASWISLQYYGSTVSPAVFGGGNKLLHNVVGGIGVYEGNGGLLRGGLPWQSVHDGTDYVHEPLRLSVCVEAPREAMTEILRRHDGVRALFDQGWLHLFALDAEGRMAFRYTGDLTWQPQPDGASDTITRRLIA